MLLSKWLEIACGVLNQLLTAELQLQVQKEMSSSEFIQQVHFDAWFIKRWKSNMDLEKEASLIFSFPNFVQNQGVGCLALTCGQMISGGMNILEVGGGKTRFSFLIFNDYFMHFNRIPSNIT